MEPSPGPWMIFGWGLFGSVAVETATMVRELAKANGRIPDIYRSRAYLAARAALAVIAGGLGVGLGATTPITALYMGASAPVLIDRLRHGLHQGQAPRVTPDALAARSRGGARRPPAPARSGS